MEKRWGFWEYARVQNSGEYRNTGYFNGYWEEGFFKKQLVINAVMGVLWLVTSVAVTGALLTISHRLFPVYKMLEDNVYQSNVGTISFLNGTMQTLSIYFGPQVFSPLIMKGFRMLTALRQGSTAFTKSKPVYSFETFYARYVSAKFDRFFLSEKRTPAIEKVAGHLGFLFLKGTYEVLIILAALAMSFGIYTWSVSDEISGTEAYSIPLFWCGLGGFAAAYGLSYLIAYLYWRGRSEKIMAAEAEAAKEVLLSDGEYTISSTAK